MKKEEARRRQTLFLFVDESGDFDFTERGSRHFVMAGFTSLSPLRSASAMQALKYELLADGERVDSFHATEDSLIIRSRTFGVITKLCHASAHVIFVEKSQLHPHYKSDVRMHAMFAKLMVDYVSTIYDREDYVRVVVVFDQCLPKAKQKVFHQSLKSHLKALKKPVDLIFQSLKLDMNGQIADYVAWAKFRQLERDDPEYWNLLSKTLRPTEFEVVRDWPRDAGF